MTVRPGQRRATRPRASIGSARWVAGLACVVLTACEDDLTEILVVIETDLAAPAEIDTVVVRAIGPSGDARDATASLASGSALPITVALVPGGDALGPVEITAEARRGGTVVITRRARTRFLEGEVLVLELPLERACQSHACTGDDTCSAGACVPVEVAPESLSRWDGKVPTSRDGGTRDAARDGEGPDGGTPSTAPRLLLEGVVPAQATYAYWTEVHEGAEHESLTDLFATHLGSPQNEGGNPQDVDPRLSPDGRWLVVRTDRDPRCPFGCVVLFETAHLDEPEVVRIGTETLTSYFNAVTNDGAAIVFKGGAGVLSISRRRADGDGWTEREEIGPADHTEAQWIVVSDDGSRALYDCVTPGELQSICEVGLDGTGARIVVTEQDAPFGSSADDPYTTRADYAPDGTIVFEANWMGNQLWRIDASGTITRVHDGFLTEYQAPCVLPDGRIVAFDGEGEDDIVVLSADGEDLFHLPLPAMPPDRTDWFPSPLGC
ncbi:MAG: hypothetical protein IT379_30840 [Deltaproteobacteria bacterium]|nr:hypothetical protein [Deltaproteobacteria bacterium]